MLDYEQHKRLVGLLESATDKKAPEIEAGSLKEIKEMVRNSNECIKSAYVVLMERLNAPHPQTRLLAVRICDELFMRSRAFRDLISSSFDTFLDHAVGCRASKPLPGPPQCAERLRANALSAIQRWDKAFGLHYPQISFGCRHLKDTLQYTFPEIPGPDVRQREDAARRARTQELLREKYATLESEWAQHASAFRTLTSQLNGSLRLLEDMQRQPAEEEGADGLIWEGEGFDSEFDGDLEEEREGLGAYDFVQEPQEEPGAPGSSCGHSGADSQEQRAILEAVSECAGILARNHLPRILSQLQVLVKVNFDGTPGESESNARRQVLLREGVEFRRDAEEALSRSRDAGAEVPPEPRGASARGNQELPSGGDGSAGEARDAEVFEFEFEGERTTAGAEAALESAEALLARQLLFRRRGRGRGSRQGGGRGVGQQRPKGRAGRAKERSADREHNEACMAALAQEDASRGTLGGAAPPGGRAERSTKRRKGETARERLRKKLAVR